MTQRMAKIITIVLLVLTTASLVFTLSCTILVYMVLAKQEITNNAAQDRWSRTAMTLWVSDFKARNPGLDVPDIGEVKNAATP